jgi:hypothetical protein
MRRFVLSIAVLFLFGGPAACAVEEKPDLSGTWKLDQTKTDPGQGNKDLVLVIAERGSNIQLKETRGPNPKDDVSSFTCTTMGTECAMQDGGDKAKVSVYYNGTVLVALKTHGKGGSVEKRRLSLSPAGDSLVMEIIHIVHAATTEKLVFSKAR